ncbi:TetR family transcriptional regulator [Alkalibaculum sp. M08DMB]|uniref:TetR family transcriptional regulator n=1 Tax=Alkalibaculum sporogenes TaxID=2655001 RepID=A0A6A7K588_9FIRM|nr:TetR/AcrR family transcriptional regulator [Alkalibaculum sporogenes]MPW24545.1 TetR family transcriptional regulator [Alkalibaculum sporogenes]
MAKKQTLRDVQAQETYNKLLDMSMHLMKKYDYTKVTISQICDACGYAKGTFYNHFNSKIDMLFEISIQQNIKVSKLFVYDKDKSASECYLEFVNSYLKFVKINGNIFSKNIVMMLLSESMTGEKIGLSIQKDYILYLLDRGKNEGEFSKETSLEELYNLWRATIIGVFALWGIEGERYDVVKDGYNTLANLIKVIT